MALAIFQCIHLRYFRSDYCHNSHSSYGYLPTSYLLPIVPAGQHGPRVAAANAIPPMHESLPCQLQDKCNLLEQLGNRGHGEEPRELWCGIGWLWQSWKKCRSVPQSKTVDQKCSPKCVNCVQWSKRQNSVFFILLHTIHQRNSPVTTI